MMMVAWAFKDVIVDITDLHAKPENCYVKIDPTCDDKSVYYRLGHCGYLFGVSVIVILFGYLYYEANDAIAKCSQNQVNMLLCCCLPLRLH